MYSVVFAVILTIANTTGAVWLKGVNTSLVAVNPSSPYGPIVQAPGVP